MTTPASTLTQKQRLAIFEEGRTAAIEGSRLFSNPYLRDDGDQRLLCWVDGYRSVVSR
ncbi:hypothetical protein SAMN03159496_05551 [Rhizobium sp. NFR07]|nr:hypothetical protein SAMN03159496_05551 [Rhizobium sp. NFR07]